MSRLVPTESVEQAALPGVGGSGDDHLDAAAEPLASPLVLQMTLQLPLQGAHPPVHWGRERDSQGGDSEKGGGRATTQQGARRGRQAGVKVDQEPGLFLKEMGEGLGEGTHLNVE